MATSSRSALKPALLIVLGLVVAILAGAAAGWFTRDMGNREDIEKIVHDYVINNPEILPKAMENLQKRENAKQLATVEGVEKPYPGAVLGNPNGTVTLVEFTDYGCGYCRQSVADVDALIKANPNLRVVVRELPILSPASNDAAKMALAAAEQGKYAAFHNAMFAIGHPSAETIKAAAQQAGVDLTRASRVIADPRTEAELSGNIQLAQKLGFTGTPSWVVGEQLLSGALGKEKLEEAIKAAS